MSYPHQQSRRQLQDTLTSLTVAEVITAATHFFATRNGVYTAFVEKQGPSHVVLRGQGGEEIAIGARETGRHRRERFELSLRSTGCPFSGIVAAGDRRGGRSRGSGRHGGRNGNAPHCVIGA